MDRTDAQTRIDRYLKEAGIREARVIALTGDASDRRYFRVERDNEPAQVLAVHPGAIEFEAMPFVNVSRLLEAMPLPAPAILGHSDPLGIIALQDLGDVTLQTHLGEASDAEQSTRYRESIALIDTLQRRGAELTSQDYLPYMLAFDVEKLTWELRFFATHFLDGSRGAGLPAPARAALDEEFAAMAGELSAEPRVLCHRDYHSRNLMWHDGRLHLIDFQDARLGPDTYDLASLLRDSYVDIADSRVEELIAYFVGLRLGKTPDKGDLTEFRRRFDLMALQRNLKALGTFGFQATTRGNPAYLQYVPRTLGHVRANLLRYPRFARLHQLLAESLDELR